MLAGSKFTICVLFVHPPLNRIASRIISVTGRHGTRLKGMPEPVPVTPFRGEDRQLSLSIRIGRAYAHECPMISCRYRRIAQHEVNTMMWIISMFVIPGCVHTKVCPSTLAAASSFFSKRSSSLRPMWNGCIRPANGSMQTIWFEWFGLVGGPKDYRD